MPIAESEFQALSTVQGNLSPRPVTIASAATIAPTTFLSVISGTVAIVNITPPVSGAHMLAFVFTAGTPTANTTAGNIANVLAASQNVPQLAVYNPVTAKYYLK